jgi:hypothetical protein
MWCGIIGGVPAVAWYVAAGQDVIKNWRASPESIWPSVFLGLAVLCFVTMLMANAIAHSRFGALYTRQEQRETATATPAQNVDAFYRTYDNRLLSEMEVITRAELNKYPADQHEKYLIRLLATVAVVGIFERTWLQIFRSQLKALHELNLKPRTYDELRQIFAEASKLNPHIYSTGTFEMWLAFLKGAMLVRELGPSTIEITIRGTEFLKYLVDKHYDETTRIG